MNWDKRFLDLALEISNWSKDPSTKVGAVIVGLNREILSTGYNGIPRGVNDSFTERNSRPTKYLYYEHGERNAIYNAARNGIKLDGATIYVTTQPSKLPCCADCARAIIQSGIKRVVQYKLDETPDHWKESVGATKEMFNEANIEFLEVDYE